MHAAASNQTRHPEGKHFRRQEAVAINGLTDGLQSVD